jgi:hypothetical protein
MPDLDGGHYFLTAILPIDNRGVFEHAGVISSPVNLVRDALEALPTALQSPASEEIGVQSPFARSLRTHFARLFVLDQPHFNGRDRADSILATIERADLLSPEPVDRLACPYLVFVVDFDPAPAAAHEPRAYLEELWGLACDELSSVFRYCYGFDERGDAAAFASFVMRGQVETTMPFNDYWFTPPPLPSLSLWLLAAPPLLAVVIGVLSVVPGGWPWWGGALLGAALVISAIWADYAWLTAAGARPFPPAPNSTLRDVLKALYLQQAFARFAARSQGHSAAELRSAFAAFVARERPGEVAGPTQPPGVVRVREIADA